MKAMGRRKAQAKQTIVGREVQDGLTTDTDIECGESLLQKNRTGPVQLSKGDGDAACEFDGHAEDQQSEFSELNLPTQQADRQRVTEEERINGTDFQQNFLQVTETVQNIQKTMQKLLEKTEKISPVENRLPHDRQRGIRQNRNRQVECQRTPARRSERWESDMTENPSDTDMEFQQDGRNRRLLIHSQTRARDTVSGVKLPAFTGKEQWKVWINRFNAIAERRGWSNTERLDELLPRLQGAAGDFVFSQLSQTVINNYTDLIEELHNRYRIVQTSKTYQAQFSKRSQRQGESVEEYAAELKRLYDMAHGYRDPRTRQEDLLRRFLHGLQDDNARFHVEYVKDPGNIDEAVYHVVHFAETKSSCTEKQTRKQAQRRLPVKFEDLTSDSESNDTSKQAVKRVPNKSRVMKGKNASSATQRNEETDVTPEENTNAKKTEHNFDSSVMQQLQTRIKVLEEELRQMTQRNRPARQDSEGRRCYNCGEVGHFARYCKQPRSVPEAAGIQPYKNTNSTESQQSRLQYLKGNRGDNSRQNRPQTHATQALN